MSFPASVRIGGVSKVDLRERLAQAAVKLNPLAESLFADERFKPSGQAAIVAVDASNVASLGFPAGATFEQLTNAAHGMGLSLCPLELGPHLRLQYREQAESPEDAAMTTGKAPPGSITVASAPPLDEEAVPWGFYLRRIGADQWLRGYRSWAGHVWAPEDVLVFVRASNAA